MEKNLEKVATENANTLIDAMVKIFINDFYGKPENELVLSKVHMNKNYIVVGKCADGSVIISENGETFFNLKTAIEVANEHKKIGLEVVVMRVKEMEFERIVKKQHYNELGTEFAENFVFTSEFEEWKNLGGYALVIPECLMCDKNN